MKKIFATLVFCHYFLFAQIPSSVISPIFIQDKIEGKNKSGIIVGLGVGIPSLSTQYLSGYTFQNVTSYGYHLIVGYQDFTRLLSPFPPNIFGARMSFEFDDTFHIGEKTINSSNLLINYDLLIDAFARRKNPIGFIIGVNLGLTQIKGYQSFSFSIGAKLGLSLAFTTDHRLDITYKVASSGPLQGDRLYFYSPYTIDLTYTYRFSIPIKKQEKIKEENPFDNTKYLLKANPQQ